MTPLVAHADWSVTAAKRWMCVAVPSAPGWAVGCEPVGELGTLLRRLRVRAAGNPVALGIDAPIGLPAAYRAGRPDFPSFLAALAPDSPLFDVADSPDGVSAERPFYPQSGKAGVRRQHLLDGLGWLDGDALLRRCERAGPRQPAAAPMFWTLGAKQVGKGAICLWRDLLLSALRSADPPALWPFDGLLAPLLRSGRTVVAETYPAQAMRDLDLRFTGSKRRRSDRLGVVDRLRTALAGLGAEPDAALERAIGDGFGDGADGEDRFDSLIGLLGLLRVVRDPALDDPPATDSVRRWEGWIIGRPLSTS